jgi:hypothetical protein
VSKKVSNSELEMSAQKGVYGSSGRRRKEEVDNGTKKVLVNEYLGEGEIKLSDLKSRDETDEWRRTEWTSINHITRLVE